MPCHITAEKEKQGWYKDFMVKRLGAKKYKELEKLAYKTVSRRDAIMELMESLKVLEKDFNN
jgi:hypothetical protein